MKKLVLILAVAFGASMVACSSSEKANEENAAAEAEAPAVEVVEAVENDTLPVNDSTAIVAADTVVAVAEAAN
ncbi:MAG: hypothetical protein K2K37_01435 [Muribaculaceae bacterium]|nr:hypothetical protein [Muribaculaceae bacterium]